MTVPTLARAIGRFVSQLRYPQVPPAAVTLAKLGLADCIAVMVAGNREQAVATLHATLKTLGGPAESTLYFGRERVSAPSAA